MTASIVVGYDGTDHGDDALALGRLLAGIADARLLVVCAYPHDPLGESATGLAVADELRADAERVLERARANLAGARDRAGIAGAGAGAGSDAGTGIAERVSDDVELRAVAGPSPSQVLHDLAEQTDAATIVVGATHHGKGLRLLTGSTPQAVLDHAPCPVAVAPDGYRERAGWGEPDGGAASGVAPVGDGATSGGARATSATAGATSGSAGATSSDAGATSGSAGARGAGTPARIAVAYDGSPEAEHALTVAASWARRAGARLRLVTAVNAPAVGVYPPPLDIATHEQLAQMARDDARARLDEAIAALGGDLPAEGAVLDGDPVAALVEESGDDDLLFTGSRGQGPFRRVLLGSVSTKLLRDASCPVVVVPRGSGEPVAEKERDAS